MDLSSELNPQQLAAVEHDTGPALVLAGAGSGKTRVITYRIARLILTHACRPEHILAVTFTNKAADEMRDRVNRLLGPVRTADPQVSTFHSFCVRLLRREISLLGYKRDFSIYDTDDQKRLMKQLLSEAGIAEGALTPREILSRISYAKNQRVPVQGYTSRFPARNAEEIEDLYARYEARLRQANALDFDDLLLKTVELLEDNPERRDHYSNWYQYILVDEYQDTNRPQYEILRLLTSRHQNLFVVGDEDQSIYKFRGADIGNILRFEQDFAGARLIKLEQNYRSTHNILDVAGAVVANNVARKGKVLWTEKPAGDVVTCCTARSARAEADWVAGRVQELLEESPDSRVGILYRANFLSRNFEDVLNERGVAYSIVGSVAFFGRAEVKDMLAYLRVLFNPEDDIALLRIINTPPRAIGQTTVDLLVRTAAVQQVPLTTALAQLSREPDKAGRAHRALAGFQSLLDQWMSLRDTCSPADLLRRIVEDIGYGKMLGRQETREDAESRMSNVEELILAAAESQGRGETIFEFLDRASLATEIDALDSSSCVTLMTVHSAKGLEFDVVFLVGLEEGLFPHSLSTGSKEDLEEERRLCYVAITRARRKLYVSWTPRRRNFGANAFTRPEPSRFLLEMPSHLVEKLVLWADEVRESDSFYEKADENLPVRSAQPARSAAAGEDSAEDPKTIAELRAYLERLKSGPRSDEKAPAVKPLKSGTRVRHAEFGEGIVLSRERVGNDFRLVVTFSRAGRKKLLEKYAKLEAL
jgi:DNA helicase-2/ATP-dependent DNA helicase PcrA